MQKKDKILITGSAGFMGCHLFDQLLDEGHNVYGVDNLSGGFLKNVSNKERFTQLDLKDRQKVADYINILKPDIIFHLAADATEGRSQFTPFSALDNNLVAYLNLLIPAIKNGLKKMILTSSMSVYGAQQTPFLESMTPHPEDIYAMAKSGMETSTKVMSEVYGFKYVIIRPHNVYGPKQNLIDPYRNVIGIFMNRLLNGKHFFIYGDGEQKRAFSYIDDVTPAMIKSAFSEKCEGRIINIGGDEPVTLNELSDVVLKSFFSSDDIPKEFNPVHMEDRPQEVKYAFSSHKVAEDLLNFKNKTNLKEGILKMIEWVKTIGPQDFKYIQDFDLDHSKLPKTWKNKLM